MKTLATRDPLRTFRENCAWVDKTWGLHADSGDGYPVPSIRTLDLAHEEPVLHELAHIATFPFPSPTSSQGLIDAFESLPAALSDRLEIAAWLVERAALNRLGARTTYAQAATAASTAVDNKDRWSENKIARTMKSWSRYSHIALADWVGNATDNLFWTLDCHKWHCAAPLPPVIWTFR